MQDLLYATGSAVYPLRDVADAADIMEAAARVPQSTPSRSRRIVDYLLHKARSISYVGISPFQVDLVLAKLLARPGAAERFEAVAASIPPGDGQVIVTDRTTCIVCSTGVLFMPEAHHGKEYRASPQLFSQDGVVKDCTLLWKVCTICKAKHYFSYAVGGHLLPEGDMMPFPGWSDMRYCHVSEHMVYETKLLKRYREQCLHSHSSSDAFSKEYDALARTNGKEGLPLGHHVWANRFRVIWRAFELVTWEQEIVEWERARAPEGAPRKSSIMIPMEGTDDGKRFDAYLIANTARFLNLFVLRWGKHHSSICRMPGLCSCYVIDGHMKCIRNVCANKHARTLDMGTLGTAVLGCTHTPVRGGAYCSGCLAACAVRGAAGTVDAGRMDVAMEQSTEDEEMEPTKTAAQEVARHKDVYMVSEVLDAEKQTVVRGGEAHRKCAKANLKRFKVSWVGYPPEEDSWVCECNVGKAVVDEWNEKKVAARLATKHAGQVAAVNAKAASGDFNMSAEERNEITDATACACLKDLHANDRICTAGILAMVSSCGLILAASEIYGSESLTQVHLFLYQVFFLHGLEPPAVLAYDDACHLSMYLLNRLKRFGRSALAVFILVHMKMKIVVDKFHWRNHTGKFCKENNNPYECPMIKGRRTERCEETFQWLSGGKHIYRHMNEAHFMFTMLRMMHHRNVYVASLPVCKVCAEDE